jgi:TPR repeat protein
MVAAESQLLCQFINVAICLAPTMNRVASHLISAKRKMKMLDFDGAIADWTAAMQINVDDSAVSIVCCSNIAAAHVKKGDWQNACRFATDAIEGRVQYPAPLYWRGIALRHLGNIDEAIHDFRRALQLSDNCAVRKQLSLCIFSEHYSTRCGPDQSRAACGKTVLSVSGQLPAAATRSAAVGSHRPHAFITRFEAHAARSLVRPSRAFVSELMAHPLYCLASRISVERLQAMCRRLTPSKAHPQQWHVFEIVLGLRQRQHITCRGGLCETLVRRLMRYQGKFGLKSLLNLAACVVSRRHFLVSKNRAIRLFQFGQRLYERKRFSDAVKKWGQAALLQHAPSHAHLSDMLIDGRQGVPQDHQRAFELAAAGAALGCAHSKGALGRCFFTGFGVTQDERKGLALGKESAAAGSCFGQYLVGRFKEKETEAVRLYRLAATQGHAQSQFVMGEAYEEGCGVAQDRAEAARWYHLAAAQGLSQAEFNLGAMFLNGEGVEQDDVEAARLHRLAAAQGHPTAQYFLGCTFEEGRGVAQDRVEATRWFLIAAAWQHSEAQFQLGFAYEKGRGVAQDTEEAIRWYQLAAFQGFSHAKNRLRRCRAVLRDAHAATS